MREIRSYGSVRGAASNGRPYRDKPIVMNRSWRNNVKRDWFLT
jgi:hypothetical protein